MQEKEIMYTRSNGEQVPIKSLNTEHILNSLSKEYRDIFNSKNKDEFKNHLDKIDNDLYNEICKATMGSYEKIGDFIPKDTILGMFEDLLNEVEHLKEEKENLERDLEDNYEPISASRMYGIDDSDFI